MRAIWLQALGIVLAIAVLLGMGFIGGYRWRNDEVADLRGALDAASAAATEQGTTLQALRDLMRHEYETAQRMQEATIAELAARADRIAALERTAARRENELKHQVETDEDCNLLRAVPVCRAISDRLFDGAGTAH